MNNWKCQATLCLRQGLIYNTSSHPLQFTINYSPPQSHTLHRVYEPVLFTVIPWYHASGNYGQYCCDNCICLWALCTIQRTHAKQCKDSMLLYTHIHRDTTCTRASLLAVSLLQQSTTKQTSALFPLVPPLTALPVSTTKGWAHLRALRDTVTTCHGSPDLGEGSSRAHTCTTCPWNAKRRRQTTGVDACVGTAEGVPCPVETNRPSEWHTGCMQSCEPVDCNWYLVQYHLQLAWPLVFEKLEWEQVPSLDGHYVQYQLKSHNIYTTWICTKINYSTFTEQQGSQNTYIA